MYKLIKHKISGKKIITTALLISTISALRLNITYGEKILPVDNKMSNVGQIERSIKEDLSYCSIAYAIKIDNKEIAYLESEAKAKDVLEEYRDLIIEDMDEDIGEIKSVEVLEDISLVKKRVPAEKMDVIDDSLSTISKIKSGHLQEKKHIIKDEENFWSLSRDYEVTMEDIERANPDKDTRFLKNGDQVIIPLSKPLITVATFENKKIEEEIEYEIEYEIDDELYKGKEEVKVKGQKGKLEKEIKVERHNGEEVSQEVIKENIVEKPVNQVIAKGTKEVELGAATGSFSIPTRGTISSPFGKRWGKLHGGMDIAARIGEPISASDGGVVRYAEHNNGGYGYMVDIDHGNGYVTRYAHCSKLYVSKGDKVNQGDLIAAVGNTGRSTGPHLHFEVRKDGEPKDPQGYLK